MKNFIEKLKDFLYDGIDYMLIIVIVIAVAGIIGWRLDILFAKDMDKQTVEYIDDNSDNIDIVDNDNESEDEEKPIVEEEEPTTEEDDKDSIGNDDTQDKNTDIANTPENKDDPINEEEVQQNEIINVIIPQGSLAPTIADILLDKGLISSKMVFLNKSQELGLDTKLKSGEFKINSNASLEEIVRIIAK